MAEGSNVDVLIVGAGPAGLMCAAWMARCGIDTRIIDKRGSKIFNGQADGLQCRTLEILDSFGFADRVWKESNHMLEICFWNPDENGTIRRTGRIPDTIPGLSRFQQVVLHQGRVERFFLDHIMKHGGFTVERGVLPSKIEIDESKVEDQDAYPIKMTLQHLSEEEATPKQFNSSVENGLFRSNLKPDDTDDLIRIASGKENTTETINCKYVVGCDGAHSWIRRHLGFRMDGEQTDFIWGVLDIIPLSDFPDIRMRCAIHSANSGSVMVIPRENKLVRLYIQLTEVNKDGGAVDRSTITPAMILAAAQKIISPYKLEYEYCDWWTAYQIGQRVGDCFSKNERIFIAGDAVHTHSPKAGQGMNVSMQDAYNLGWKIAYCVQGKASRSILKTYQSERRRVAQDLIAFDHKFSRLFSGRPAKDAADEAGISMDEFKDAFEKGNLFASGLIVNYGASMLVTKEGDVKEQGDGTDLMNGTVSNGNGVRTDSRRVIGKQGLAPNIQLGMRMPSFQVLNQADARPWQFQEFLKSDGRFRIVVFAGDLRLKTQFGRVQKLAEHLASENSCIRRYTPAGAPVDSTIEIMIIHSAPRVEIELLDLHPIYHPWSETEGWDYWKVFVDDLSYHEGHGHAYENYGIDKEVGCVVIVRPDGYVGHLGDLDDVKDIDAYFENFMIACREPVKPARRNGLVV